MAELGGACDTLNLRLYGSSTDLGFCFLDCRCLQTNEAAGMGEGWSDAMAEYVHPRWLACLMNADRCW